MESHVRIQEQEWVERVCKWLEEEMLDDPQIPVSIFTVPKTLISTKPDAYFPQQVALGPYHHRRSDLYEMERYKLSAAKRIQKQLKNIKFRDVVARFVDHEISIRAYYHKNLDFDGETLAWMLAIDASFLLEYLQTYHTEKETALVRYSSNMAHLVDYTGRKSAHHAILRDIIMLENQIPLFLLRELLGFYNHKSPDDVLAKMAKGLCKDLSPIKAMDSLPSKEEEFVTRAHLLELLYYTLVPATNHGESIVIEIDTQAQEQVQEVGCFGRALASTYTAVCRLNSAPIQSLKYILSSKQITVLVKLPWKIIRLIHRHVAKKSAIENLVISVGAVADELESADAKKSETPLIQDLMVANASKLSGIGIKFRPTKGGLSTVEFDKVSATFYLPVINLDENSEVVLRNLVAFEAWIAPEEMALTRYTELMKGIVSCEQDVKLLREKGVILNRLKSDAEVVTLWHGMSKAVKTTKVPVLDKAIEGINAYYSATWKIKAARLMKKYVFRSWPFLTFFAANILLLMTTLQTYCSMFKCSRSFSPLKF